MAWTPPQTWLAATTYHASDFNREFRDNLKFLYGRMQVGTVSITPVANTPTSVTVTFPTPFASTPIGIASPASGVPGTTVLGVGADTETTTTMRVTLTRTNTTVTVVRWMAFIP